MKLPKNVAAFLREVDELRSPQLRINPLSPEDSVQASAAMQELAVGRELGLIVLDDANDSNPYCLISRGPAKGMVVHFSHDPEPEIRFSSLSAFGESLRSAVANRLDIEELPRSPLAPSPDQATLTKHIEMLLRSDDENSEFQVCLLVPLLEPAQFSTINQAATNESFLIRESVAEYIAAHPLEQHLELARQLADDPYPQVSGPGKRALSSVNQVRFTQ